MKRTELEDLLVDFIEIPSVTGAEHDYSEALASALVARGFDVERQEVEPGRCNLLARAGRPRFVFCTHLDTVPEWFGSRVDGDFIHGRGSCDAKGQAVAMLAAGTELLRQGQDGVAFLFTVGEETVSDGAKLANARLAEPWAPEHILVGEPTSNRFVRGHKGLYQCELHGHGVAGHSSQPIGPSAIHELIHVAERALATDWGQHPVLGQATLNLGRFEGGVASNVVADKASLSFLLRAVEGPETVRARIEELLGEHVTLHPSGNGYGPVEFLVPDGEPSEVVAFGTDAPYLRAWGTPLLFGAGSILDAHTDHEKIGRRELEQCVARHVATARALLERSGARG
ncbi:MAG: M20/M25/M40 family metallo-hydrolase [Planctomycetota bacterium]